MPSPPASPAEAKRAPTVPASPGAPAAPGRAWIRPAACALGGALCFLSSPPWGFWPLAWVALAPLLWAVRGLPARQALLLGWLAGVVEHGGGFSWMVGVIDRFTGMPLAGALLLFLVITAWQGFKIGVFAALVSRIGPESRWTFPVAAALLRIAVDTLWWMPFPATFAFSQVAAPPVAQVAELGGPHAVMFLLVLVAATLVELATRRPRPWRQAGLVAAVLAAGLVFGLARIQQVERWRAEAPHLAVGLVQLNAPLRARGQDQARAPVNLRRLQEASAALERQGAQLVIWSETEYPYMFEDGQDHDFEAPAKRLLNGFHGPLVTGANVRAPDRRHHFNSALSLVPEGRVVGVYKKNHRVPIGEYIPLLGEGWFDLVNAHGVLAGTSIDLLPVPGGQAGAIICLEDILPRYCRHLAQRGPDFLISLTNDTWFGDSGEPSQHLALATFRCIEARLDMARCTSSGISGFISASGRLEGRTVLVDPYAGARSPLPDTLLGQVALMKPRGLYVQAGDLLSAAALLASLAMLLPLWRGRRATP